MSYRNDVDALAARHAALAAEADQVARKRDEARQLLDEARAKARQPVLANIRVASPCSEAWAQMNGDDRVRACAKCQQNVYNLSAMTREQAEALVRERNGGRLCVRYFQRFDGTILLADCELGRKSKRRRRVIAAGIAASVAAGIGGIAAQHSTKHVEEVAGMMVMGEASVNELPPSVDPAPPAQGIDIEATVPHVPMKL